MAAMSRTIPDEASMALNRTNGRMNVRGTHRSDVAQVVWRGSIYPMLFPADLSISHAATTRSAIPTSAFFM